MHVIYILGTIAPIKLLQVNLNHTLSAHNNLLAYIFDNSIDSTCIQDPYLHRSNLTHLPAGFRCFNSTSFDALILIFNNELKASLSFSTITSVFVDITLDNLSFTIGSVYF